MWFTLLMIAVAVFMIANGLMSKKVMLPTGATIVKSESPVKFWLTLGFWVFWIIYFACIAIWGDTSATP